MPEYSAPSRNRQHVRDATTDARTIAESPSEQAAFSKAATRLLPMLFVCYIVAYLDRVNIGFAKLQMVASLEFSDAVYGFGAGIFFIGYFLFEVPSNLILERVGARAWIARIMITWAMVSGAFAFVAAIPWGPLPALFGLRRVEFSFYALRFLLGIAEAGFFPGIILYLTYWFPAARRARTVALFMTAVSVANVVGAPLSGAIMQYLDGWAGWAGWRWLFVVEAIPSLIVGVAVLTWLPDRPANARWLNVDERDAIVRRIDADRASGDTLATASGHGVRAAFSDGRVWMLAFVYLTLTFALYAINFWMPTLVQEIGIRRTDYLRIGLVTMIPWGLGGMAMVLVGAHSDRTGERRWHATGALLVTALGMALLAVVGHAPAWSILALSLVTCGTLSAVATFWAVPTAFLRHTAAAAGIAWINSVGNLGGHFGPDLIGRIREATGSSANAFVALSVISASGALVMWWVTRVRAER
ncbi:MAG: MFS transporter [Gemmatimonadaceae bacterium]|nr:MFS transporter [Gemmatimonadaceae bacterium]